MYSLNWENQSALISDIIPLPPCLIWSDITDGFSESREIYTNLECQLGFDETLYGAIPGLHELKHLETIINPNNMINQTITQDNPTINHTKNPNFRKRHMEDYPKQPSPPRPQRFELVFENKSQSKKLKSLPNSDHSACISFTQKGNTVWEPDEEAMAEMKEMIYMEAAMKPINLGFDEPIMKPRRKNVKISSDPQTVCARKRRERISEKLRVLQRLVPGGDKLDTASMLDEAANYVKFLKSQVKELESIGPTLGYTASDVFNPLQSFDTFSSLPKT